MTASIPASSIVRVTPGVIGAGGTGLVLSGLILSNSGRVPIGTTATFSSAAAVAKYFGPSSQEALLATKYFASFTGSFTFPAALLFAPYPVAPVAAYLRGGPVSGLTLAQLRLISGVLTVPVDAGTLVSTNIDLSAVNSFSGAATAIGAALAATVTYDAVSGAFVVTSSTIGANSSVGYATGAPAAALGLTAAVGAVTSAGAVAATPVAAMTAIAAYTQNFATFMTAFKPSDDDMVAFAQWTDSTIDRFAYVQWDSNPALTSSAYASTAWGRIQTLGYSGIIPYYTPIEGANKAAALMGWIASINFTVKQGRANLAFRSQVGLLESVTDAIVGAQLEANGVNFYGAYATASQPFVFFYPGVVSGPFAWLDSFTNQIWLNNAFQLALMNLLTTAGNLPYNGAGYARVELQMQGPIDDAVAFGAIQAGVPLSASQKAAVNGLAGRNIADTITQRGWYLLVTPASPTVRAARGSPGLTFFYADGQSIQRLNLTSVEIA
jgi:hypothetical protein